MVPYNGKKIIFHKSDLAMLFDLDGIGKKIINFINDKILPNPDYASHLGESEQSKLRTIYGLMHSAAIGTPFDYNSLYNALLPLSGDLDKNMIFLAYLYHGSLYDYDENWTLTLEKFIHFVADDVLEDSRFAARIDNNTKKDLKVQITTAKIDNIVRIVIKFISLLKV